ncbi:MAG TPA: indolepyruvate ferredoxin oxidoreductase family protein [Acidimicrobiales bacterium]|nr:indolepyruvate ferredoxin oxidoreductase family protein [Acidimicrobiales bacterium]
MTATPTDAPTPAPPTADGTRRRLLSGVEALCEALVVRRAVDAAAGVDTATFVSGYPGSPLGTLDLALARLGGRLGDNRIVHQPGLNEELAAAAVWGSQMGEAVPYADVDGVVGAWYGKGPGLDRCGDVLKHANFMGTGPNGGAVLFVGDDPSAKSSTLPYDTNAPLADAAVPVLVPADQQDLLDLAVEAFRLSRACGSWVGVRIVTAVADGIGAVDVDPGRLAALGPVPELLVDGEPWRHEPSGSILRPDLEELWLDRRLRAAQAWVEARGLDRFVGADRGARLGIVCAGRTYRDVLGALEMCGVTTDDLAAAGIRILKLALTHPVVPSSVLSLADTCDEIVVVEEKRPFVEQQLRAVLHEAGRTTPVRGKRDQQGRPLVPGTGELTAERIVDVLVRVLPDLAPAPAAAPTPGTTARTLLPLLDLPARTPAFCSGCPHNRSTVVPEGSVTGGGVGCHGMIHFEHRHADETFVPPTPMGAEGVHWVGLAPFVGDRHIFQNLGDGTFSHSGSLAVRACVAAGVHITFKLLYNSAVAMTGGQDVAGLMDVPALTRSLAAEGVSAIAVCTDDVGRYGRDAAFAPGVQVRPREDVIAVQEELREHPGVSVLIYDQRCAAEARRLRKRGELDEPPQRVVINEAVCEGCGDCSRISNCLSVLPVETEFGERREIHQSSCNKDFSCLEGDCPSFLTIVPKPRASRAGRGSEAGRGRERPALPAGDLPDPAVVPVEGRYSVYTTGIGGTGIVTANRLLAHAALAAGFAVQGVDQTGLSQKAGAVVSHLHVGRTDDDITTATVPDGGADLYLSGDLLQAASATHLRKVRPRGTWAVVDADLVPTAGMLQGTPGVDHGRLTGAVQDAVGRDRAVLADTTALADRLFGSHLPANVVLLGIASQLGALPVPPAAVEHAIETQGPAAETNVEAFRWGRWLVADRPAVDAALGWTAGAGTHRHGGTEPTPGGADTGEEGRTGRSSLWDPTPRARAAAEALVDGRGLPAVLRQLLVRRAAQVVDYQGGRLAERWLDLVARAAAVDEADRGWALTTAVAEGWFKVLTYKDEYEVARLHLRLGLDDVARAAGVEGGYAVQYRLHPPTLRRLGRRRKIALPSGVARPAFRALAAMRRVRGTPLDLFGLDRHRREERQLAADYGTLVAGALDALTPTTYDDTVALAAGIQSVRGYEDIKSEAIARWRAGVGLS